MSYSCTVKAHDTLRLTLLNANNEDLKNYSFTNTWEINGQKYFYERGREQADGSITGTIFIFVGETQCRKFGSLKILADGTVKNWSGMPKDKILNRMPSFYLI